MPRAILAIDQGSTNTKAMLVGEDAIPRNICTRRVPTDYPRPGWVQHDATDLWQSVCDAIDDTLSNVKATDIIAIGLSSQRESAVAWDKKTGEPIGPVISWQCRRTRHTCAEVGLSPAGERVQTLTGQPVDPTFSAAKMHWLLEGVPDGLVRAEAGDIAVGNVDAWLLWKLSGGAVHRTDVGNASRTQLFNLYTLDWDDELLAVFGVPRQAMPEIRPSGSLFAESAGCGNLPSGIPVAAVLGDSHAALFGHLDADSGAVKATYGTGTSLMGALSEAPRTVPTLGSSIAWGLPDAAYALEGNITSTGAAVQWMSNALGLGGIDEVTALVGDSLDTGGVYLVPAFNGLAAPYWRSDARAVLVGITQGTGRKALARSALASIAFQVADVLEEFRLHAGTKRLLADGGASRSSVLMQYQADISGVPVIRNASENLSALGAAYAAGLQIGFWPSREAIAARLPDVDVFEPKLDADARERLLAMWRDAVDTAIEFGGKVSERA